MGQPTSCFELIALESRRLLSGADSDDSLGEVLLIEPLAAIGVQHVDGVINVSTDVDLVPIRLVENQSIELVLTGHGPLLTKLLGGGLRLFDADGVEVRRDNGSEFLSGLVSNTRGLSFTADRSGVFYVGVSASENMNYEILAGTGDVTTIFNPLLDLAPPVGNYRLMLFPGADSPQPTNGTGHWYGLTSFGTWQQAKAEAEALGGHLVHIDSVQEQQLIEQKFVRARANTSFLSLNLGNAAPDVEDMFWIGLTDSAVDGDYRLTNGAVPGFFNWAAAEPTGLTALGGEDFGILNWNYRNWSKFRGLNLLGTAAPEPGTWNDVPNDGYSGASALVLGLLQGAEDYRGIIEFDHYPANYSGELFYWEPSSFDGNTLTLDYTQAIGNIVMTLDMDESSITVIRNGETIVYPGQFDSLHILLGPGDDNVVSNANIPTYVLGGSGDDTIYTGDADDIITGGAGRNRLFGRGGNDKLNGSNGRDFLRGGEGDDRLYGFGGQDDLAGEGHVDRLYGGDGPDFLKGGASNDKLYGQEGDDILNGEKDNDLLFGGPGNDLLDGKAGNDTLFGDDGDDTLYANAGNDQLFGGDGNDMFFAELGQNFLYGEAGNDLFFALTGSLDYLDGGEGDDLAEIDGAFDSVLNIEGFI